MSFLDRLKLIPTVWRAMRDAKKQGLSRDETEKHVLQAGLLKAAENDGHDEGSARKFLRFLDENTNAGIKADEECMLVWEEFDEYEADEKDRFELTEIHLKMIRALHFTFDPTESGAPTISPERPYGSANLFADLEKLTGESDRLELAKKHTELYLALKTFLKHSSLGKGTYKVSNMDPDDIREISRQQLDVKDQITITAEQLVAMKALLWEWVESDEIEEQLDMGNWPVPKTDPKRPYGNFTYYQVELAEFLGWEMAQDEEGNFKTSSEQDEKLANIHNSLPGVFQVYVENADLAPGVYEI